MVSVTAWIMRLTPVRPIRRGGRRLAFKYRVNGYQKSYFMLVFQRFKGFLCGKRAFLVQRRWMTIFSDFNLDKIEALL
jgi:hypothetical protein